MKDTDFPSEVLLHARLENDLEAALQALSAHLEEQGLPSDRRSMLQDYQPILSGLVQSAATARGVHALFASQEKKQAL